MTESFSEPWEHLIGALPDLHAAVSRRARRTLLAKTFRRMTGARRVSLRPGGSPVRQGRRVSVLSAGALEVHLESDEPFAADALAAARWLAARVQRLLNLPVLEPIGLDTCVEWLGEGLAVLREQPTQPVRGLSPQRQRVAQLAARSLTDEQIARRTGTSRHTVAKHLTGIYEHMEIEGREQLARRRLAQAASQDGSA